MRGQCLFPKGAPGYGTLCLGHSWMNGGVVIDKITLTAPGRVFCQNVQLVQDCSFDILQFGNYYSIAIVGEAIDPVLPMYVSVVPVLRTLWLREAFSEDVTRILAVYMHAFWPGFGAADWVVDGFLSTLGCLGFTFSALEIAFDFIGSIPFEIVDEANFNQICGTMYTKDFHKSPVGKGNQDSMLAIYDKGKKLAEDSGGYAPLPMGVDYQRLEFRIKQANGRRWLHLGDLRHNLSSYVAAYGPRIKKKADSLIGEAIRFDGQGVPELLDSMLTTGIPRYPEWMAGAY